MGGSNHDRSPSLRDKVTGASSTGFLSQCIEHPQLAGKGSATRSPRHAFTRLEHGVIYVLAVTCYACPMSDTDNLVLEDLRTMRIDLGDIKKIVVDLAQQLIGLRKPIHALEGNALRIEEGMARVELRVEKIEKRVGLIDV